MEVRSFGMAFWLPGFMKTFGFTIPDVTEDMAWLCTMPPLIILVANSWYGFLAVHMRRIEEE